MTTFCGVWAVAWPASAPMVRRRAAQARRTNVGAEQASGARVVDWGQRLRSKRAAPSIACPASRARDRFAPKIILGGCRASNGCRQQALAAIGAYWAINAIGGAGHPRVAVTHRDGIATDGSLTAPAH